MNKTRPFAVFDIDGTLVRWQMVHAIFDHLGRAGHLDEDNYKAMKAARQQWKQRRADEGYRTYEKEVVRIIDNSLVDIPTAAFDAAVQSVFDEYKDQVYVYSRDLITELKNQNYILLAISGSVREVIKLVADYYGFDDFVGSHYIQKSGKFTGEVEVAAFNKPAILKSLTDKHDLSYKGSLGIGDSESDIGMLNLVEKPIAFNPEKGLFRHAQDKGWKIVMERKNMIYELEPTKKGRGYELARTNA